MLPPLGWEQERKQQWHPYQLLLSAFLIGNWVHDHEEETDDTSKDGKLRKNTNSKKLYPKFSFVVKRYFSFYSQIPSCHANWVLHVGKWTKFQPSIIWFCSSSTRCRGKRCFRPSQYSQPCVGLVRSGPFRPPWLGPHQRRGPFEAYCFRRVQIWS